MSGCDSIGVALDGYHDGELDAPERARVERHLADCARCRGELAQLVQLGGLLRSAVGAVPDPDLWDSIAQRLPARRPERERPATRRAPQRQRWMPPLSVAAAAAACAVAFLVTTSDTGPIASIGGASGVVRSLYANERPVMVLEPETAEDATIIWLMDEAGEQTPEVSVSVGI